MDESVTVRIFSGVSCQVSDGGLNQEPSVAGKGMTAKCPMCGKTVKWEGNVFRPFCSERCHLLDLEGWFGERYRIPKAEEDESDERVREEQSPSSDKGTT